MTAEIIAGTTVTPAVARAWIDRARQDDYRAGVLGLLASPDATRDETFAHEGQPVRIVTAASVLAVHQAIRDAVPGGWLIIVTDRRESDLGPGLLAHFVWHRLRHPDAWQAVAQRFGAFSIDPRLNADAQTRNRALASGLLELAPAQGWPAAPAGVLTRDHAFGCVARFGLELPEGPIDLVGVLHWSTTPGLPGTIARLRSRGGDPLVDAVLDWVAEQAGEGRDFVAALLRGGTASDLVPLGVVLDCLFADGTSDAHLALARLQHRWGQVARPALAAVGRLSCVVVSGLLGGQATSAHGRALISRADDLLVDAGALALAGSSRLLSAGLTMRLRKLAGALDAPTIDLSAIEPAWLAVSDHQLVDDPRLPAARAGVRLARWLSTGDAGGPATLATLTARHLEIDGWVDSAVNDAEAGVDDHALAAALERVLDAVRGRRDSHDLAFASAIAREGCDERAEGVLTLERLLPEIVLPLAKRQPTLLLVLDGMSVSVAVEIMGRVGSGVEFGLVECLLPGASERTAALAALPSVTEASRTSLLTGRLASGQQDAERAGFKSLARSHGLAEAPLFHKRLLDSGRGGFALADEVRLAVADTERTPLVACVLNTIDDALDRNDPAGTDWAADSVKHLAPLLRAARAAGRVVVLTSDHGHVVERRRGVQRGVGLGGRVREASGEVGADEVLVAGPRVLTPGHRAVLAVNERLRYGPLKAGYHGGAAPAEVVVPVLALVPAGIDALEPAPVAEPAWWDLTTQLGSPTAPMTPAPAASAVAAQPDLFAEEPEPIAQAATASHLGHRLVATDAYKAQRALIGRLAVSDDRVSALVDALAAVPDHRLSATRVGALIGVPLNRVPMAMTQVAKLLNVEGYAVVSSDPGTQAVVLDPALLSEQYGVVL